MQADSPQQHDSATQLNSASSSSDSNKGTESKNQTDLSAGDTGDATMHSDAPASTAALPAPQQKKRLASSSPLAPIWTVQAQPVFFDAERPQAKELAKAFVAVQQ